jgi:hypothetical protein
VLGGLGRLGTCCERVAANDKKKEGEDIDDIRGGGTISCVRTETDGFVDPAAL